MISFLDCVVIIPFTIARWNAVKCFFSFTLTWKGSNPVYLSIVWGWFGHNWAPPPPLTIRCWRGADCWTSHFSKCDSQDLGLHPKHTRDQLGPIDQTVQHGESVLNLLSCISSGLILWGTYQISWNLNAESRGLGDTCIFNNSLLDKTPSSRVHLYI